jgi:hypothetical protein
VKDEGQVLYLKDIRVVLNPDSILRAVVPILLTTPIDVDLGTVCILCVYVCVCVCVVGCSVL